MVIHSLEDILVGIEELRGEFVYFEVNEIHHEVYEYKGE